MVSAGDSPRNARCAGEHLEQDGAAREDVGALIRLAAPRTCSGAM